ncbi:S41 family peptidase [Aquimarina aggregata]|uniref:S41 family peptidase n=1 Tax=Aquimarina aggregata TaxID=1642818 RepID=UPI0024933A87|nr:S41 family peptidase [Aquimarina aggregata]
MLRFKQVLIILLVLQPILIYSQKSISESEKNIVIENIKVLIDSNYVFNDKVKSINNSLDSLNLTGKYNDIRDYKKFEKVLTDDLVEVTKDLHFKVRYHPEYVKNSREQLNRQAARENEKKPKKEVRIDWDLWYAKKENFGFEKVEILGGNIGYIKYNFWYPLEWTKSTLDATMKFIANTDALIIDLTENGGGYSPTDSYLGSYFFDKESILWSSSYTRPTEETESEYTFKEVGGERYLNKLIFILVSEETFSLGEKFAYCMKHFNKATIVGQTSAGAAHGIDYIEVNDNFMIQLPISHNIHPITQTDWEGTGVIPNIVTSSNTESIKTTHLNALNKQIEILKKQTIVGPILKRYEKIKMEINNR